MEKQQIGVIGLAVMGKNLALNIADHNYSVSVFNRSVEKTNELVKEAKGFNLKGFKTLKEFTESLEKPRKIILMVKAGDPVDSTIDQLIPLLSKGDIIIDGGNSHFEDTIRRNIYIKSQGLYFIGTGISGGEEGARFGPAIMPGGDKEAYKKVEAILTDISAKVDGEPCCTYIGDNGAGHFVKMVHNGIEYADMQLISEAYSLMKNVLKLNPEEIQEIFAEWDKGELSSYLIEITSDIFAKKDDETGKHYIDLILDSAGQKGTGKWTSEAALNLGVPIPTITLSVYERYISSMKEERLAASKILKGPKAIKIEDREKFIESIRRALYASKICSYAQGFGLMNAASKEYGWNLDLGSIAMIFRGGCIIRAQFLNKIKDAYDKNKNINNLLLEDYFKNIIEEYQNDWRDVVINAIKSGVPVSGFTSALSYYDSYRTENLPANLLQAQRDYFGAHTYERIDKEGIFHTNWIG